MPEPVKITEIRNPASIGWEATIDGTTVQIAWPRGSKYLLFAMKRTGGKWTTTSTLDRDRWAVDGTLDDAKRVAHEFLKEGAK